MPASKIYNR